MNTGDFLGQYFASLTPWLVTFILGAGVFLIGKILQKKEREKAAAKDFALKRNVLLAAYGLEQPQPHGQLGDYPGKSKTPQTPTVPLLH